MRVWQRRPHTRHCQALTLCLLFTPCSRVCHSYGTYKYRHRYSFTGWHVNSDCLLCDGFGDPPPPLPLTRSTTNHFLTATSSSVFPCRHLLTSNNFLTTTSHRYNLATTSSPPLTCLQLFPHPHLPSNTSSPLVPHHLCLTITTSSPSLSYHHFHTDTFLYSPPPLLPHHQKILKAI